MNRAIWMKDKGSLKVGDTIQLKEGPFSILSINEEHSVGFSGWVVEVKDERFPGYVVQNQFGLSRRDKRAAAKDKLLLEKDRRMKGQVH